MRHFVFSSHKRQQHHIARSEIRMLGLVDQDSPYGKPTLLFML